MDQSNLPILITPADGLVKIRGWLLIFIGPALCASMIYAAYFLAVAVVRDPAHPTAARWHGDHEMTVRTFSLFGAIFLFGLMCIPNGISLLWRGRLGVVLIVLSVLIVGAVIGTGYQVLTYHNTPP